MKLAVMSYTLSRGVSPDQFDIPAMCRLARELNIDGIDMVSTYGRKAADLRKIVDDHGLKTICHTFMADLNVTDASALKAGLDVVRKGIEDAVVLGTDKIMAVTPGKSGIARDKTRSNFVRGLQQALPWAKAAGITLTVENFPGADSPFVLAADFKAALKDLPELRLTFDSGNVYTGGEDPADSFRQCAKQVVHSHFKDWDVVTEATRMKGLDGRFYQSALIGEGSMAPLHKGILDAMREARYPGYIDMEYEGQKYPADEATRRIARYLRTLAVELN
jgi:sugar phosphate isomerase/epimerase